jgi:hypothetical protein
MPDIRIAEPIRRVWGCNGCCMSELAAARAAAVVEPCRYLPNRLELHC